MGEAPKAPNPPLQPWNPPQESVPPAWIMAAKKGCAQCMGRLRVPPAAPPFSGGPNVGRYLCMDCWTLYWDEHPENLADADSRRYVAEEARRIRLRRQASVLFQEGPSRIYLSSRGTLILDLHSKAELAPNEFDAEKLALLGRAIAAVSARKEMEPFRAATAAPPGQAPAPAPARAAASS